MRQPGANGDSTAFAIAIVHAAAVVFVAVRVVAVQPLESAKVRKHSLPGVAAPFGEHRAWVRAWVRAWAAGSCMGRQGPSCCSGLMKLDSMMRELRALVLLVRVRKRPHVRGCGLFTAAFAIAAPARPLAPFPSGTHELGLPLMGTDMLSGCGVPQ